jgi:hypothetical protein
MGSIFYPIKYVAAVATEEDSDQTYGTEVVSPRARAAAQMLEEGV